MEASLLQVLDLFGSLIYGFPPIVIGTFIGWILGSRERMIYLYRALLGAIISIGGGYLFSFLIEYLVSIPTTTNLIILSIMSFAGGVILGALLNWKPLLSLKEGSHVIYELDNDEDFEREIEESFHGS
jgi:hypothetical protein